MKDYSESNELIKEILKKRKICELPHNLASNRAHTFYKILVTIYFGPDTKLKDISIPIVFVDLAGSYKFQSQEELSPIFLKENKLVNKSIFYLDRVLNFSILNQEKTQKNIPFYKESKLTLLLFEFLFDSSNNYLIFHINAEKESSEYKDVQNLLEDIGIFSENQKKKPKKEVDSIKKEVKKSLKKSEKSLNSLVESLSNTLQDKQGQYLTKFMYFISVLCKIISFY